MGSKLATAFSFRAAIEAGCRAVMTGHLLVPALDRELATISLTDFSGVLRDELGFAGGLVPMRWRSAAVSSTMRMVEVARPLAGRRGHHRIRGAGLPGAAHLDPGRGAGCGPVRPAAEGTRLAQAAERTALLAAPGPPRAGDGHRRGGGPVHWS